MFFPSKPSLSTMPTKKKPNLGFDIIIENEYYIEAIRYAMMTTLNCIKREKESNK